MGSRGTQNPTADDSTLHIGGEVGVDEGRETGTDVHIPLVYRTYGSDRSSSLEGGVRARGPTSSDRGPGSLLEPRDGPGVGAPKR